MSSDGEEYGFQHESGAAERDNSLKKFGDEGIFLNILFKFNLFLIIM